MLTLDDVNAIYKKYEYNNFFYKITSIGNKPIDFIESILMIDTSNCELFYALKVVNCFWTGGYYVKSKTSDTYVEMDLSNPHDEVSLSPPSDMWEDYDLYLHMFVDEDLIPEIKNLTWHPVSSLTMSLYTNDDYLAKKIYLDFHGNTVPETVLAGVCEKGGELSSVPVLSDGEGYYINAVVDDYSKPLFAISYDDTTFYGRIMMLNNLPHIHCGNLYRGTPQVIKLFNNDTGESITEFQAYYNGKLLRDNIIHIPYDADEYVNIVVDLIGADYPKTRVKLKACTELFNAMSQDEVEAAIGDGIQTLQVGDTENNVELNSIELSKINLINSNILLSDSSLTDCEIINGLYVDNGDNRISNTLISQVNLFGDNNSSIYTDCIISECEVLLETGLHLTGTIKDTRLIDTLIISDGNITITNNSFYGVGTKNYFPSYLYVTGDYTVTGNTFNLTGEWTEPEFNMCIIKSINTFNPSVFISQNTFDLNIIYEDEPTNTLYYNIVDDDRIKAVRLE